MATKRGAKDSVTKDQVSAAPVRNEDHDAFKEDTARPINNRMPRTKPGQVYIALADGQLVPVEPGTLITSLDDTTRAKDQPIKVSQTMTLSENCLKRSSIDQDNPVIKKGRLDFKRLIQVKKTSSLMNITESNDKPIPKFQGENIKSGKMQKNSDRSIRVIRKYEPAAEPMQLRSKTKANFVNQYSGSDQGTKVGNSSQDDSLADSEGNGDSSPEYIYDTLEEESEDVSHYANSQNEDLENESELSENQQENSSEEFGEELLDDHMQKNNRNSSYLKIASVGSPKNTFQSNSAKKNVKNQLKKPHTSQLSSGKSPAVKKVPKHSKPNRKSALIDKSPILAVPDNLDQFGDCLKTRLGRYRYGLTLNDPPTQFFQGVLKGASGQTLAAMFGDVNLLTKFENVDLSEIGHFVIDTTFKVIPNTTAGVSQLLIICILHDSVVIPLWYALMSCCSVELYKRILIEFQQHVLDWPFLSALVNDDLALCKALRAVSPDIELYGSWFHYCYSIWKEVNFYQLVDQCKQENPTLMKAVKLLMVVPYLPPNTYDNPSSVTMADGFEYVRQFAKKNSLPQDFQRVLNYVATFWFNTVKAKNFTLFGKHSRALNHVELLQLSFLSYMKANGNVWAFTRTLQNVAKAANLEFNRYLNGKRLIPYKNRGKKFNVLIRQNLKKLMSQSMDLKTFLEKSTVYLEEILDILLHPLYPTASFEKANYVHTDGWKVQFYSM